MAKKYFIKKVKINENRIQYRVYKRYSIITAISLIFYIGILGILEYFETVKMVEDMIENGDRLFKKCLAKFDSLVKAQDFINEKVELDWKSKKNNEL